MSRQSRAIAGPVELLDAMVAFFTPSNIKDRFATRKHLRSYLKASFRRHLVKNAITALCICFAVALVMVITGYVNSIEAVYAASAPRLKLPCDLIIGKQDTSYLLRDVRFRPPAAPAVFTPQEMSLAKSINTDALAAGLKTNIEIDGQLYQGFVFPSSSALAKIYGVSQRDNTLVFSNYPNDQAEIVVWFNGENWTYKTVHSQPNTANLDYPDPAVPVVFLTEVPPVFNQLLIWAKNPARVQERLLSTWEQPYSEATPAPAFWSVVVNPWYVITRDSPQQVLLAAKQVTTTGIKVLLYVSFAVMVLVVYNILFVSYFTRQREAGILKTVGFTSHEIYVLLQTEVVICSLIGIVAAVLLSRLAFVVLPQFTLLRFSLSVGQQLVIAIAALIVFYLGSIVPVGLLRDTPVMRLLRQEALKRAS